MTAADPAPLLRLLALETALAWLAGDPDALDRADQLAVHALETGQTADLVADLLDCLGIALGTAPNVDKARQRLDHAARTTARVVIPP